MIATALATLKKVESVFLGLGASLFCSLLGLLTLSLSVYSWFKLQLGQFTEPKNRTLFGYAIGGDIILIGVLNGLLTLGTGLFVIL